MCARNMGGGADYYTFMSLKFFLYTFRFWKRAATNGETGRPIWDMHSVSLNNINIWGSKFTNNSPVPGAFTNKEASRPMWISSICGKRSVLLLSEYAVHMVSGSTILGTQWTLTQCSLMDSTSLNPRNGVTHSTPKFPFRKQLSGSWWWYRIVNWVHFLYPWDSHMTDRERLR